MSGVLKQDDAAPARSTKPPWRPLHEGEAPALPVDPEIARLRSEIALLERRAEEDAAAHRREIVKARAEAILEAKRDFKRDEAAALERLENALQTTASAFEASILKLEALAPALCWTVLENVFGQAGADRDLISAAIDKQITALRRESITFVAISPIDFPNASALEALSASYPALQIRTDAHLASGECRIGLELGQVELSIDAYRREVQQLLQGWASA